MDDRLSTEVIKYALRQFFTDPAVTDVQFFKMGGENTTALPVLSSARFVYELLKYYLHGATRPRAGEIIKAKKAAYQKFRTLFEEQLVY
jgi:hypothetical protein